jgi:hypothetical protein
MQVVMPKSTQICPNSGKSDSASLADLLKLLHDAPTAREFAEHPLFGGCRHARRLVALRHRPLGAFGIEADPRAMRT